jgi:hypothetical protein
LTLQRPGIPVTQSTNPSMSSCSSEMHLHTEHWQHHTSLECALICAMSYAAGSQDITCVIKNLRQTRVVSGCVNVYLGIGNPPPKCKRVAQHQGCTVVSCTTCVGLSLATVTFAAFALYLTYVMYVTHRLCTESSGLSRAKGTRSNDPAAALVTSCTHAPCLSCCRP